MKKIVPILFLIACAMTALAQDDKELSDDQPDGGRLEALKIAYLTKKLNLSPEEAQRFWPIYNNYAAEIRRARVEQRQRKVPEIEIEERILGIRKKYNSEFSRALNSEKINTFFRSEKDFGNYVQKELAERRQLRQMQLNRQRIRR